MILVLLASTSLIYWLKNPALLDVKIVPVSQATRARDVPGVATQAPEFSR
jgi:hypothetical protein